METDYSSLLNPAQLQAVTTKAQHVRIIAGAGSGKTRVLTYRIAYLIEHERIDPYNILAVTFTNKAAQEMKDRVAKLVPEEAAFLSVFTFHSFCSRFLRKEAGEIGYPPSFTIFDEDDQEKLVKDIAAEKGLKKGDAIVKEALRYIRSQKGKGVYPDDIVLDRAPYSVEKECLSFYVEYERRKTGMLSLDFDDLILQTVAILKRNPMVREKWAHRFSHILVDEFQDTNDQQYELLKLLMTPSTCLYVVGDPDQTIYTWRGANQEIILSFPKNFPDYQDIILNQNYRSTQNILGAANELISHNKMRVPKALFTQAGDGEGVVVKRFSEASEEAKWVVEKIQSLAGDGDYRNIAVLYRSSYLTRPFESEFAQRGVPYRIFGGLRFYQRKEVKDVLAYFRLLLNPLDDVSFERIVNVPKRAIGEGTVEKIRAHAQESGVSEYAYCQNIASYPHEDIPSRSVNQLNGLIAAMENCKKKLSENLEVYSAVLKEFITDLGYYQFIAEDQGIDEDRAGNVNALFDDINHFISANPDSTFAEYLQNVSLLTSQDDMNGGNYVSLMTIHVAKGLEFDDVFIIGMNQGSFPSMRSQEERGNEGMEEERRLCYVAMTRARKRLFMTCNSGYSYVTDTHAIPSQFFKEAKLEFPKESLFRSAYATPFRPKREKVSWTNSSSSPYSKVNSFFGDGEAISPFEEPKKKETPAARPSNGISDWALGDRCHHDKFGDGTVSNTMGSGIIVVKFDSGEVKTLLGTHPLIHRISKKGGEA
ncbi:MAG TPA: ATP-dependent DNA helicase [Firmicutes bacterium]|nr:ATP-dependent DNA helicase [Bacillota bacterium]